LLKQLHQRGGQRRRPDEEFEMVAGSLRYRGGQGIDSPIFFNPTTGRYAVLEAKGGFNAKGLSALSVDTNDIVQGSDMFITTRLARYGRYGDGQDAALANVLFRAREAGMLDSYGSFYGGKQLWQLPMVENYKFTPSPVKIPVK
jgi:hypothetical protein